MWKNRVWGKSIKRSTGQLKFQYTKCHSIEWSGNNNDSNNNNKCNTIKYYNNNNDNNNDNKNNY